MDGRTESKTQHVVIVGGGFAGLFAAKRLGGSDFRVTLIDKRNFQLFQPLLYQVATGSLAMGDIVAPQRVVMRRHKNVFTVMGTVYDFDPGKRIVYHDKGAISYDILIVATGVKHHYFGNDHWREFAPGLKTLEHAAEMRRRIFSALEAAELETDERRRASLLTFVVVGGGPTGVELAGALGELTHRRLVRDFRNFDSRQSRILLVEGTARVLPSYPEKLSEAARHALNKLGVKVMTDSLVEDIQPGQVIIRSDGASSRVEAETVLWAAGVRASAFGEVLSRRTGVNLDKGGKVKV
jgi:NADH dehydrogenase